MLALDNENLQQTVTPEAIPDAVFKYRPQTRWTCEVANEIPVAIAAVCKYGIWKTKICPEKTYESWNILTSR